MSVLPDVACKTHNV